MSETIAQRPFVWIEWIDAGSVDAWMQPEEMVHGARRCVSAGFLMRETADEIFVSGTVNEDGHGCCTTIIPAACITRRLSLTPLMQTINSLRDEDLRHG